MGFCNRCGSEVAPAHVDREREIATCPVCGNVVDLRARRKKGGEQAGASETASESEAAPAAPRGRRSQRPSAFVILIPILVVPAAVAFMVHTFSSEVEGSLELRGELGTTTFRPSACSSGEIHGFKGVELTAGSSARRVRVIEDELGESKLAVLEQGAPAVVVRAADCTKFAVKIVRTGTVTNDVYLMEGSATLDCPSVRGRVTYARCGL